MRRALLLSTALLLAACGGDDDQKAAYVQQANAVCADARSEFAALTVPTTPEAFGPYAEQLVAVVEKAQVELEALTPPEEDREELERRVLRPLDELVEEGEQYVERIRAAGDDQAELLSLLSERPTAEDIDTDYLREYGAVTCAEAIEAAG